MERAAGFGLTTGVPMGSLRTTWREGDQALVSHKTQL